jgi:protein phosphatase
LSAVIAAQPRIDGVICLGDIVNYGPHPARCVAWVRENALKSWVVQGNHDRALGCDEDPGCSGPYRALAAAMQLYTAKELDEGAKRYLAGLPPVVRQEADGATFLLCHAAPSDPLYAYVPLEDTRQWADEAVLAQRPDFLLVGHTHIPFIRQTFDTTIVNPGSVGQPKDEDPRASYAVWDDGDVELLHAEYDVASVVHDLASCAEPEIAGPLANVLRTGGDWRRRRFW